MLDHTFVPLWDRVLLVIFTESVVDLGGLTARLRYVILEERNLIVVTEVLKPIFEALFIYVLNQGFSWHACKVS